jgi:predicted MFS family arabinose efflux permease
MKRLLVPYRAFLAIPDVKSMLVVGWLSRLPVGMSGLAMVLFLREALGSFSLAGIAVGAYFVAMAIAAPIQGRIIDRIGPRRPLIVTGIMQPLMMLLLFYAADRRLSEFHVVAAASLAGAFATPITVLTRTLWRHRFHSDDTRRMAFAVDSILMELSFTIGPLASAALIAAFSAKVAFLVSAASVFFAFLIFYFSRSLNYWKQEPVSERHLLGPLTDLRLLLLFITTFGLTTAFGLLEVGYPAYATSLSLPAMAGVLLSINSVGSAVGGAIYGGLKLNMPTERQYTWLLSLMVLPLLLHGVVDHLFLFGVAAFLAGVAIAPSIAAQSLLVARMSPPKYATEAFTWSSTFIVSGIGAGMALGGTLAESVNVKAPFVCGGLVIAAMALLTLGIRAQKTDQLA